MSKYTTWITEKDKKVDRVIQVSENKFPGSGWRQVPNDWAGNHGDNLSWFDNSGYRIPDYQLIKEGIIIDNRGKWYHKEKIGESRQVYKLGDDAPGNEWTRGEPIKNESFQRWDDNKKKFVIDEEKKEETEKEQNISEIKNTIQITEQKILRSIISKVGGKATTEDEKYFETFSEEIKALRALLNQLEE